MVFSYLDICIINRNFGTLYSTAASLNLKKLSWYSCAGLIYIIEHYIQSESSFKISNVIKFYII